VGQIKAPEKGGTKKKPKEADGGGGAGVAVPKPQMDVREREDIRGKRDYAKGKVGF